MLSPLITVSEGASIEPEPGKPVDFTSPASYTVTAEDGTTQVWTVTVTVAVSVADDLLKGKVQIYPNPNNGRFYITMNSEQQADFTLQVLNLDGRMVYTCEYHSGTFSNELTDTGISVPGIYLVKIISGRATWTDKLVVQ